MDHQGSLSLHFLVIKKKNSYWNRVIDWVQIFERGLPYILTKLQQTPSPVSASYITGKLAQINIGAITLNSRPFAELSRITIKVLLLHYLTQNLMLPTEVKSPWFCESLLSSLASNTFKEVWPVIPQNVPQHGLSDDAFLSLDWGCEFFTSMPQKHHSILSVLFLGHMIIMCLNTVQLVKKTFDH